MGEETNSPSNIKLIIKYMFDDIMQEVCDEIAREIKLLTENYEL